MSMLPLFTQQIADIYARENFYRIQNYTKDDPFRKGNFTFFELVVPEAVTAKAFAHNLNFQPLDVIQLSVRTPDTAVVTWHYDQFDSTSIFITTDGPCTIRAYLGRYGES